MILKVSLDLLIQSLVPFQSRAQFALDFVLEHLPGADRTTQTILLRDATVLCSTYPVLFNEKVLACVRQKNNISPSSSTLSGATTTSGGGTTMVTMTNSVVTSFDEETTTTTTPVAIMKPVARERRSENRVNGHLSALTNGSATLSSTTTTTSGGVTIVKLNVAPTPVIQSNQVDSTVNGGGLNGKIMSQEKVIEGRESKTGASAMVTSSSAANASFVANGGATSPPHTG